MRTRRAVDTTFCSAVEFGCTVSDIGGNRRLKAVAIEALQEVRLDSSAGPSDLSRCNKLALDILLPNVVGGPALLG